MKSRPLSLLFCIAIATVFSACATSYQKTGITGGYTERDMGRNVWRITFAGNGYTSSETVQTYWLYRCAEVALSKGFSGFEILSDVRLTMSVPFDQFLRSDEPQFQPAQVILVPTDSPPKPMIQADVLMLSGAIQGKPPKVFDAKALKEALEPMVKAGKSNGKNVVPHIHDYLYPGKVPAST